MSFAQSMPIWDGLGPLADFAVKVKNHRRPKEFTLPEEKLFWQWKDQFAKESISLLNEVKEWEFNYRKDLLKFEQTPIDIPKFKSAYKDLKLLNSNLKKLLFQGLMHNDVEYTSILQKLYLKKESLAYRQYDDQIVILELDWLFFETNYHELNSIGYSNNQFKKYFSTKATYYRLWENTDQKDFF